MKEQERLQPERPGRQQEKGTGLEPITSDSIKNAHAAGDGAMERSLDSIPDEEELKQGDKTPSPHQERY